MRKGFGTGNAPLLGLFMALSLALVPSVTEAQGGQNVDEWEMRVCADPEALPFSNQLAQGFENRIAEIIADELGATLSYDWYPQGPNMITYRLRAGECDMIVGVPDGSNGLLTTITYYRSPYVFVYRADSEFEVESFDDEVLHELRIAVQNVGIPPHDALVYRGLSENIVDDFLEGEPRLGAERSRAVIQAVIEGDVDLALAWGPVAGYLSRQSSVELELKPVQPQFEPPFRSQSFPMTMGVRLGDEGLRDLLDIAIANRWDEIQQVLGEYGVPVQQTPRPRVGTPLEDQVNVALITPTMTGSSAIPQSLYDVVGESARNGALLAESRVGTLTEGSDPRLVVLTASAPTAEAALRAAERMAVNNDIAAFVGGLGENQAETLAEVAERTDVPFFNIGSPFMARDCRDLVFHVEASGAMYLRAISAWHSQLEQQRWFIVQEEGDDWARLAESAAIAIAASGASSTVAGTVQVSDGKPSYWPELQEIRESDADVVLLLLGPRDQIAFLAQMASAGLDLPAAPFPGPVTQAREFLAAALSRAGAPAAGHHLMLWETTLEGAGAGELNQAYTGRFAEPMDPAAWAAYQAITIFRQAVAQNGPNTKGIVEFLESSGAVFDVAKGVEAWFGPADHQLRQPLFIAELDPNATWRYTLSAKIDIASLAGQVPSDGELERAPREALERLAGSPDECAE